MVKIKKRKKATRQRGAGGRSCGWGFRQKHKGGHGNSGGAGMAGTGKRSDHKKFLGETIAKNAGFKSYFGKQGFTSRKAKKPGIAVINLETIEMNFFEKVGQKIDLKKYKILGEGKGFKAEIFAKEASQSAIEKMEKAGGKIILPVVKEETKIVEKIATPVKENIKSEKKVGGKKKEVAKG